jgi:hypothetical protein
MLAGEMVVESEFQVWMRADIPPLTAMLIAVGEGVHQSVLNDLLRARYSSSRMIWLLSYPLPPPPILSVSSPGDTQED